MSWTPENLAREIFTKEPAAPCTQQLGAEIRGDEDGDITFLFEMIITFMMEGMDILMDGLEDANLENFSKEHILAMEPWFQGIGFTLVVDVYDIDDLDKYAGYYCSVIINTGDYKEYFSIKNLNKNFHFLLNGQTFKGADDLKDLRMIFRNSCNDKVYSIGFNYFIPNSGCR